jgi:hypothetical protein
MTSFSTLILLILHGASCTLKVIYIHHNIQLRDRENIGRFKSASPQRGFSNGLTWFRMLDIDSRTFTQH